MIQTYKYQGLINVRTYKGCSVVFLNDSETPLINEIDWNLNKQNIVFKYLITDSNEVIEDSLEHKFIKVEGKLFCKLYIDNNITFDEFNAFSNEIYLSVDTHHIHDILMRNKGRYVNIVIEYDKEKEEEKQREINKEKNLKTAKKLYYDFEKFCKGSGIKSKEIIDQVKKESKSKLTR